MTCTVSDTILDLNGSPLIGASVYAVPDTVPLFLSGIERQISHLHTLTDAAGRFSLPLPWPSVCDPTTVKWQIVLPDAVIWKGTSPESVTGPLTLKQLKDTYAWGLVSGGSASTIVAVQGPAGTGGASYPGVTSDGADGIAVDGGGMFRGTLNVLATSILSDTVTIQPTTPGNPGLLILAPPGWTDDLFQVSAGDGTSGIAVDANGIVYMSAAPGNDLLYVGNVLRISADNSTRLAGSFAMWGITPASAQRSMLYSDFLGIINSNDPLAPALATALSALNDIGALRFTG